MCSPVSGLTRKFKFIGKNLNYSQKQAYSDDEDEWQGRTGQSLIL